MNEWKSERYNGIAEFFKNAIYCAVRTARLILLAEGGSRK